MQHGVLGGRPVHAYEKWNRRVPGVYRTEALDGTGPAASFTEDDPHCLATLKHYRSLMPMAQEARKPMFHLRAADGALGCHIYAVQDCYEDFKNLEIDRRQVWLEHTPSAMSSVAPSLFFSLPAPPDG